LEAFTRRWYETYRKLPLEEMARRSFETTMAQLTRSFEKAGS